MTIEIPLTKGYVAIIDDEDFDLVSQHRWHVIHRHNSFYAASWEKGKAIYLHRFILRPPEGYQIDHKDGDGLNCTRGNMRLATCSENTMNRKKNTKNTSGYKGVNFHQGKWAARIVSNEHRIHLGYFDDPIEAAKAYDSAARKFHGDFAQTNFDEIENE